jgi:hypothetical protein
MPYRVTEALKRKDTQTTTAGAGAARQRQLRWGLGERGTCTQLAAPICSVHTTYIQQN